MTDKMRFEGLTLTVESVERSIGYYSGKLGLTVELNAAPAFGMIRHGAGTIGLLAAAEARKEGVADSSAVFAAARPSRADTKSTLNPFIDAARAGGIGPVVFLSVAGAEQSKIVPHHAVEAHLISRGGDFTLLLPGFFAQHPVSARQRRRLCSSLAAARAALGPGRRANDPARRASLWPGERGGSDAGHDPRSQRAHALRLRARPHGPPGARGDSVTTAPQAMIH